MYLGQDSACGEAHVYEETDQVKIKNLIGLWIILSGAVVAAFVLAIARKYLYLDDFLKRKCMGNHASKRSSPRHTFQQTMPTDTASTTAYDFQTPMPVSLPLPRTPPRSGQVGPALYCGAIFLGFCKSRWVTTNPSAHHHDVHAGRMGQQTRLLQEWQTICRRISLFHILFLILHPAAHKLFLHYIVVQFFWDFANFKVGNHGAKRVITTTHIPAKQASRPAF